MVQINPTTDMRTNILISEKKNIKHQSTFPVVIFAYSRKVHFQCTHDELLITQDRLLSFDRGWVRNRQEGISFNGVMLLIMP